MTDLNLQPPDLILEREYIPPNLRENIFSNQAIDGMTPEDQIPITKANWIEFLDGMDEWSDHDDSYDEGKSAFLDNDEIVDPLMTDYEDAMYLEDYSYPPNFDLEGYEESMLTFNEQSDDFYGILADAIDYEDPVDKTALIDNGRDVD